MEIFISHDVNDRYLMNALQSIINKSTGFEPIVIVRQENVMQDFVQKVQNGINSSFYFVPILSERSYQNVWVNQEIGYALGKGINVIPIVEKSIIGKLTKGFIHNYRDLPYSFLVSDSNNTNFRKKYRQVCQNLLDKLIQVHQYSEQNVKLLSEIFNGIWRTEFDQFINIREYGYYVNGKLEFFVDQFQFSDQVKRLSFRKIRAYKCNEVYKVELTVNTLNRLYTGTEQFSIDGGLTWGKSYPISFKNMDSNSDLNSSFNNTTILHPGDIVIGKRKSKFRF